MKPLIDCELWVPVEGYETFYEISNQGRIRSLDRYEILEGRHPSPVTRRRKGKLLIPRRGVYLCVILYKDGVGKGFTVHRLVAKHFCDNPLNKPEVNHIDEDKFNNHASNLEWMTSSENSLHSSYKQRGEKCSRTKLKEEDVLTIKRLLDEGELSQKAIGEMFNISNHAIFRIKAGYNWSWLTGFGKEETVHP